MQDLRFRCCSLKTWLIACSAPLLALSIVACQDEINTPRPTQPTSELATASAPLSFKQVSAGRFHSCGVASDDRIYCWGYNQFGQLGDGTTSTRYKPTRLATTRRFLQVTTGALHSCGLTTESLVFCWGDNSNGQLGNGTTVEFGVPQSLPVAVAGGRTFRQVSAGYGHTCAVGSDNRGYCWGSNLDGQLGDGVGARRLKPFAVAGGLSFRAVSAGKHHSCAVTPTNRAYCWGTNSVGQLGDSTNTNRLEPVAVGTRRFRLVEAGHSHTCAVSTADRAFCWGYGLDGQIGNGRTGRPRWPSAVAGGLYFTSVSAGELHSCGVTTNNRAYCWGYNDAGFGGGLLGDGTTTMRTKPVAVLGGLSVNQVTAGDRHTCTKTTGSRAYCWGANREGELGDATTTGRTRPVAVVGP